MTATILYLPSARRQEDDADRWASRAHGVIDEVERLLDVGRVDDVEQFCEFAIGCLQRNATEIPASDDLWNLSGRLADLRQRARLIHRRTRRAHVERFVRLPP